MERGTQLKRTTIRAAWRARAVFQVAAGGAGYGRQWTINGLVGVKSFAGSTVKATREENKFIGSE